MAVPALPPGWQQALSAHGFGPAHVEHVVTTAYGDAATDPVFPARPGDVFRAFQQTPLVHVRAVILGQDPYYRHLSEADGLAFSARRVDARSTELPPALKRIFANLEETARNHPTFHFARSAKADLTPWARQGVLLLNTALTVEQGTPESHLSLWSDFIDAALAVIRDLPSPVALMLWGEKAKKRGRSCRPSSEIFRMPHPAARADSRPWLDGSRYPFLEVNEFLDGEGRGTIDWSLGVPLALSGQVALTAMDYL